MCAHTAIQEARVVSVMTRDDYLELHLPGNQ
jgi:hypothetical protein